MIEESEILQLKHALSQRAEELCRQLLPNGRKSGNYWRTGSIDDDKGWSLFVGLQGPFAGEWRDGATDERGDILALVRTRLGLSFPATIRWARQYLGTGPAPTPSRPAPPARARPNTAPNDTQVTPNMIEARLIFVQAQPIADTHAAAYLRARKLTPPPDPSSLRYHPNAYLSRDHSTTFPALFAAMTDHRGRFQALHRTYLDPDRPAKAKLRSPRLSLAPMGGSAIRFGPITTELLAVGEGLETMLALRTVLPNLSIAACTSRVILAKWIPSRSHRWILIAADNGEPGITAAKALRTRLAKEHPRIETDIVLPIADDFAADLVESGPDLLREHLVRRLAELRNPALRYAHTA